MDRGDGAMAQLTGGRVLIVAGSDSSGGAGIVRDVEVAAILGARAAVAITAVTAQTDQRVEAVEPMTPALVTAQMRAALASGRIGAVKTGMLVDAEIVASVWELLSEHADIPLVVDPVVRSSSGAPLLYDDGLRLLRDRLLPRATVVTPNLPELALLTGKSEALDEPEAIRQAEVLLAEGGRAVLIKGGHVAGSMAQDMAVDILVRTDRAPVRFETARLPGTMRGTGCALATAIAVSLAQGEALDVSIGRAKHTVFDLIGKALRRS
jgi:hydroxymethylpyrimidine/phosphomethylpyrimidine kinase